MDSMLALTNLKAALIAEIRAELKAELKAEILSELGILKPEPMRYTPDTCVQKVHAIFTIGEYDKLEKNEEAMSIFSKWYATVKNDFRHPKHAFNSLCKGGGYITIRRSSAGGEYIQTSEGDQLVTLPPFLPPAPKKAVAVSKTFRAGEFPILEKDKEAMAIFARWYKTFKHNYCHPAHAFNSLCKHEGYVLISSKPQGGTRIYTANGSYNVTA